MIAFLREFLLFNNFRKKIEYPSLSQVSILRLHVYQRRKGHLMNRLLKNTISRYSSLTLPETFKPYPISKPTMVLPKSISHPHKYEDKIIHSIAIIFLHMKNCHLPIQISTLWIISLCQVIEKTACTKPYKNQGFLKHAIIKPIGELDKTIMCAAI